VKPKVYLETSVISYLTGRVSRDLVVAARQQLTQLWWDKRREQFDLYVSSVVVEEISAGDPSAAVERQNAVLGVPILEMNSEALSLAQKFLEKGSMPAKAADDAFHIALAAVYGIDYLLTWNCTHIANASIRKTIEALVHEEGFYCPTICTPDELLGEFAPNE